MNTNDICKILASSTQDDWIVDDETGSFTYRDDVLLRIQRDEYDNYRLFNEPWATEHPDSKAMAVEYTVWYGNSFIERETLVSVDGHRATLPMPISKDDLRVEQSDVNFARIVSIGDRVEEYLRRSGIQIVE